MKPVHIQWIDAHTSMGSAVWLTRDEILELHSTAKNATMHTVGFVVEENADGIILAQSWCETDDMFGGGSFFIPKAWVIEKKNV